MKNIRNLKIKETNENTTKNYARETYSGIFFGQKRSRILRVMRFFLGSCLQKRKTIENLKNMDFSSAWKFGCVRFFIVVFDKLFMKLH